MSTPLFPAEPLAAALALIAHPDPRAELTASIQVYGGATEADSPPDGWFELEGAYWSVALALDGRSANVSRNGSASIDLRSTWRRELRELRAILNDPRVSAIIEQEGR